MENEDNPDSQQAEPYAPIENEESLDQSKLDSPATRQGVWLLPAIVVIVLMWALAIIPGMLRPLTFVHFMSLQGAPVLGALAILIWWMTSRRVPLRHRLNGLGMTIGFYALTMFASHSSMGMMMFIYGIPVALTVLVLGMLLGHGQGWSRQGWIGFAALAIFLLGSLVFRIGSIDAAFAFSLVPRWTPTAEQEFLAELEKQDPGTQSEGSDVLLPSTDEELVWAEFRGPDRTGIINEVNLSTDWSSDPPQELWRKQVGPGWSSVCVAGPLAFTQEQRGESEAVVAYFVDDGAVAWIHEFPGRFEASMGGIGPRATPTYRDGKLYVTGASGVVFCLDASTGDRLWEYDLIEQLEVRLPEWGFSSSPLVLADKIIVFAGGDEGKGTVALSRETGELLWSSGDGSHGYSSPQLSTIHGIDQVLVSSNKGIRSFQPDDGTLLWQHDWDIGPMARVTQPMVVGNTVYLGTGYGNGTQRIDVLLTDGEWSTDEKWIAPMKPYFNDAVYYDGHIYGFDGKIFMCIDAEDGSKVWKKGRYGHGQVLLIQDQQLLLIVTEKGELVLVKADPEKHQEIAKMESVEGVTWNHPVIADGKLYVRNAEEFVCYEI